LRYAFAGSVGLPPSRSVPTIHFASKDAYKTIEGQKQVFEDALNRLALQTAYDSRDYVVPIVSSKDKGSLDILHQVFTGPGLSTLLQEGLARISEVEDEQDNFDNVDDLNVESDQDSSVDETEDVDASYKMLAKEKQLYKTFSRSNIGRQHTMHRDLKACTASHVACADGSHAVFRCPGCPDTFDANIVICQLYRHIEHPKHWDYFATTGIPCEFECGRGFLDETHQLMHYASGTCAVMAAHAPSQWTAPATTSTKVLISRQPRSLASLTEQRHSLCTAGL
jgi:hypothetical protein